MICVGCSLSPDATEVTNAMLKSFLKQCDIIAVRDLTSQTILQRSLSRKIGLFGDVALVLPFRLRKIERTRNLGINVMFVPKSVRQEYYTALLYIIDRSTFETITLFTTGNVDDEIAARHIFSQRRVRTQIFIPESLEALQVQLGKYDVVVATRLHAAILALNAGTPVYGILQLKLRNFLATISLESRFYNLQSESLANLVSEMHSDDATQVHESISGSRILAGQEGFNYDFRLRFGKLVNASSLLQRLSTDQHRFQRT